MRKGKMEMMKLYYNQKINNLKPVMCMGVLPAFTSAPHACHAHRVQKRALAPLELKSQIQL